MVELFYTRSQQSWICESYWMQKDKGVESATVTLFRSDALRDTVLTADPHPLKSKDS